MIERPLETPARPTGRNPGPPPRALHALLIEDRDDAVRSIARPLAHAFGPVEFLAVGDLETFRVALEYGDWDIVLSDPDNRRCPPEAVLEILAEDDLPTPFLLVAADRSSEHAQRALRAGAHGCVPQWAEGELAETVQRLLNVVLLGARRRASDDRATVDPRRLARRLQAVCDEVTRCVGELAGRITHGERIDPKAVRELDLQCADAVPILEAAMADLWRARFGE